MKLLITVLFLFFLPKACNTVSARFNELQKRQDIITITYQAVSRGFFEEISISKNAINISNDLNGTYVKSYNNLTEDWNACLGLLSNIEIHTIPKLKAPTSYRYADGAAHATLIIKDGDKETISSEFDHGYPPKDIKELVEMLQSFKKLTLKQ